jgi:hypothetical protein
MHGLGQHTLDKQSVVLFTPFTHQLDGPRRVGELLDVVDVRLLDGVQGSQGLIQDGDGLRSGTSRAVESKRKRQLTHCDREVKGPTHFQKQMVVTV